MVEVANIVQYIDKQGLYYCIIHNTYAKRHIMILIRKESTTV